MKQNILLAGVGGQGILSLAYVICNAALEEGLNFKQAEVHGMAQRGGAVQSNLRISSEPIMSDLIPKGECDLILSVEPLESLRYIDYLSKDGVIVTSINPHKNIPNYPELTEIWSELEKLPTVIPIDSAALAKKAGSPLAQNMVMLGAGSGFINIKLESLENWVKKLWEPKGEKVVNVNLEAFRIGRKKSEEVKNEVERGMKTSDIVRKSEEAVI